MASETTTWDLYKKGLDYHNRIGLLDAVDKAERFYSGDQWNGVVANGLPTPVFNIHKRVIDHFISSILSQDVKMTFTPANVPKEPKDETDMMKMFAAGIVNEQCNQIWERLKMSQNMRHALRDAGLSGDMVGWIFWNEDLRTANPVNGVVPKGDIDFELIDNVNVFFGNPNDRRVERQPYIIISFRALVEDLKAEAKANGVKGKDIEAIVGDADYSDQAGDRAKVELSTKSTETAKTTALVKMWKDRETGKVMWSKSTKFVDIIKAKDTGLSRYMLAMNSWGFRKNSYHGIAVGTEIIPNQIFINKMFAMVMLNLMQTAFPKAVYNTALIDKWSNQIGEAIPVESGDDMRQVAMYLQPAAMSSQVMNVIDAAINYTKQMLGANDAALGDIRPENHSAIIALQQAAMVPLETVQKNLYQWVEDIGRIWFDMMANKYGIREVIYKGDKVIFDFGILKEMQMNLKIDVGPCSYWSEITSAQTLDNLFRDAKLTFLQYLERMPDGYIPKRQELIEEIKKAEAEKNANPPAPINRPSVSISFDDLPVAGKIQIAEQIGVKLSPQDFQDPAQTKLLKQLLVDQGHLAPEQIPPQQGGPSW